MKFEIIQRGGRSRFIDCPLCIGCLLSQIRLTAEQVENSDRVQRFGQIENSDQVQSSGLEQEFVLLAVKVQQ